MSIETPLKPVSPSIQHKVVAFVLGFIAFTAMVLVLPFVFFIILSPLGIAEASVRVRENLDSTFNIAALIVAAVAARLVYRAVAGEIGRHKPFRLSK